MEIIYIICISSKSAWNIQPFQEIMIRDQQVLRLPILRHLKEIPKSTEMKGGHDPGHANEILVFLGLYHVYI